MSTKERYWNGLVGSNKALAKDDGHIVSLSVGNLRRIVHQAYERGARDIVDARKKETRDNGMDMFNQIFGKR